jgi:hypothetical protein
MYHLSLQLNLSLKNTINHRLINNNDLESLDYFIKL